MSTLGCLALLLALATSVFSSAVYVRGAKSRQPGSLSIARTALFITFGLVSLANFILLLAIFTHNFSLEYVASYTSRDTSFIYLFSAWWAGNAGSLSFWTWLLSLFAVLFVWRSRSDEKALVPYASGVLMLTEAFFIILLLAVANPFNQLGFTPADGRGLNPLLENAGMIFHPPALLVGYVGLTIPFALAVAALLSGCLNSEWVESARRWALVSWLFLGVGNIIGTWWAYVELGWGGYWAWDPVENAGLMPWLVTTAFLHSIMLQRRKGLFKTWNLLLIILSFNLVILGTYLTRSNVLSSVHTFGLSGLSPYFITYLCFALLGPLYLLYLRRDKLKDTQPIESLVSRESTFYLNNLLLGGAALIILLGTVFPALYKAVNGAEISLGESFFNQAAGPLFLAVIALIGVCTVIGWQKASTAKLKRALIILPVISLIPGIVLLFAGVQNWRILIISVFCGFAFLAILYEWSSEINRHHRAAGGSHFKSFLGLLRNNTTRYGGYIVHVGIVVIAAGILSSSFYTSEEELSLEKGESVSVAGYTLTYDGLSQADTASKTTIAAQITVKNSGKTIAIMTPEKSLYQNYEQPVTEVAIRSTLLEDLYVILVGWDDNGAVAFQVKVNPLVSWIWVGGGILLLGGLVAFLPARRKLPVSQPPKDEKSTSMEDEIEKQVQQLRQKKARASVK